MEKKGRKVMENGVMGHIILPWKVLTSLNILSRIITLAKKVKKIHTKMLVLPTSRIYDKMHVTFFDFYHPGPQLSVS